MYVHILAFFIFPGSALVGQSIDFFDFSFLLSPQHAITYDGGARFGDRAMGYAQARYLSFMTDVPFIYRPFLYSEYLTIDFQAAAYDAEASRFICTFRINSAQSLSDFFCKIRDPNTPPTLFVVEYFPTDITEWDFDKTREICFHIPWHDPEFHSYLQQSMRPRIPIPKLTKKGFLNVADHVRTLSGGDALPSFGFTLKHTNLEYHRRQIRRIYEWNLQKPMYVFLFSDTKHPLELLESFRNHFLNTNIEFGIQFLENPDTDYAIQDFFAMQEFDALIATQSNFSMMAWRLGSFDLVIHPEHSIGSYPDTEIDRVHIISKKSEWFPFELDMILKDKDLSHSVKDWFPDEHIYINNLKNRELRKEAP